MRRAALPLVLLAAVVGCGERSTRHGARGIVRDVQPEYGQVVIEHLSLTYLIDAEGRIAERYLGLEHEAGTLLRDLRPVASD